MRSYHKLGWWIHYLHWLTLLSLLLMNTFEVARAAPATSFIPPDTITVRMFHLSNPHGTNLHVLCAPRDTSYGCSAFADIFYPYPTNPATIPIETDYLLDVVSVESMVSAMHATAMQAQAIAARTYAYWHIQRGSIINNSNEFQVFVPYAFERLNPAGRPDNVAEPCASANLHPYQRKVCAAVAPRWYVTTAATDLPIHAEFFADIPVRTLSGARPTFKQLMTRLARILMLR